MDPSYEYLKDFPARMRHVGMYLHLFNASGQKAIWKEQFENEYEQMTVLFSVLLFIMDRSLKDEICILDDITAFLMDASLRFLHKSLTEVQAKELADFLINDVLSNKGEPIYVNGFNFAAGEYEKLFVSYIANRTVYVDGTIRRTSYSMTDDGYDFLLGTLEIESNMKLPIQSLIFSLHIQRQSFDRALDDVRSIFGLLKMQYTKIQEAIIAIRRNALTYSSEAYAELTKSNLETIAKTRRQFEEHDRTVRSRMQEIVGESIDLAILSDKDRENLRYLQEISVYLTKVLDSYQKIMGAHFEVRKVLEEQLVHSTQLPNIRRFHLRTDLFDRVLEDPSSIGRLDQFLYPLFSKGAWKTFHPGLATQPQTLRRDEEEEDEGNLEDFDPEVWLRDQEERRRLMHLMATDAFCVLGSMACERGQVALSDVAGVCRENPALQATLIPTISLFKALMVSVLGTREVLVQELRREKQAGIQQAVEEFRLGDIVLTAFQTHPEWAVLEGFRFERLSGQQPVIFEGIIDEDGERRRIRCSDVMVTAIRK